MTAKKQKNEVSKHGIKKVEFAFTQGEKELSATIEASNSLESKASRYVTIFIALLVVSIGSFFTAYFDCASPLHRHSVIVSLILFNLFFAVLLYEAMEALKLENYFLLGNKPQNLLNDEKVNYIKLVEYEARDLNRVIEINRDKNIQKIKRLKEVEGKLLYALCIPLLVLIICELI